MVWSAMAHVRTGCAVVCMGSAVTLNYIASMDKYHPRTCSTKTHSVEKGLDFPATEHVPTRPNVAGSTRVNVSCRTLPAMDGGSTPLEDGRVVAERSVTGCARSKVTVAQNGDGAVQQKTIATVEDDRGSFDQIRRMRMSQKNSTDFLLLLVI
mmetsp:Transcript_55741/g.135055  ORF Transcript_55741/g.135055 Transcript_55741/m.135055 type:complete len:153 (+) Transcript_55741:851-1309(+)